jgi:PPOX class probable F420-dependent enzyme
MKLKTILTTLLALLYLSLASPAQNPLTAAPERAKLIAAAKEVIEKARYCAFVTIGDDGAPQARVVDPFAPEDEMTIWIATNPVTRKVAQIRKNPQVSLLYFDRASFSYVSVLGKAEVIDDPAEKAKRWKEDWAAFYKDKNRGPDYLLIRVRPRRLEVINPAQGFSGDPQTWRPATLDFP